MDKIPPFDYLAGEDFTERLKELTGCRTLLEMSERFSVPKTTFSAWNTHNRTSHELIVRIHLALGVPIEEMALKPEDRKSFKRTSNSLAPVQSQTPETQTQHSTVIIKSFCLTNGKLLDTGELPYAVRRMNSYNLNPDFVIEVETNEAIYLVDKNSTNPVSGKYLIDIDGTLSINHIQRLPGKKLAVVFGESTVDVAEEDIKVVGRVAVTLRKD